jgi:hypothetical protein
VDESTMQQHIIDLKISNAKLCTEVNHLTEAVSVLNEKMDRVTSAIDTNKGAQKMFMALSGLFGAALTYIIHKVFGL